MALALYISTANCCLRIITGWDFFSLTGLINIYTGVGEGNRGIYVKFQEKGNAVFSLNIRREYETYIQETKEL